MSEREVAPGLLVAMPHLSDPNFRRAVVLMVQHTAETSFGLIVNHPTDTPITEVMTPLGVKWHKPGDIVWMGGPVMPGSGWLLHEPADYAVDDATLNLIPGLSLSNSQVQLRTLAEQPPGHLRFLMGYAGWGGGQLESELARGDWLLAEASAELIFTTPAEEMWEAALRQLGVDPASLVPASGVH